MYTKARIALFQSFRRDAEENGLLEEFNKKYPTFTAWEKINFSNAAAVEGVWNNSLTLSDSDSVLGILKQIKDVVIGQLTLDEFYAKFVCDGSKVTSWASTTEYCKKKYTWKDYPCVTNIAAKHGIQADGATDSYHIGDYMYYKNGRRYNIKTKQLENYNCNSPELKNFQPETGAASGAQPIANAAAYKPCTASYTRGCYSDKIKEAQVCLGLTADGKFGSKTEAALKAIGFPNGFTDDDVVTICKGGKNIIKSWLDDFPTCVRGLKQYYDEKNSYLYGMGTGSDGKLYHIWYYSAKYNNGFLCRVQPVDGGEIINGYYNCATNDNKINISTLGGLTIEGSVLNPEVPKNRPIKPEDKLKDERKTVSPDIGV